MLKLCRVVLSARLAAHVVHLESALVLLVEKSEGFLLFVVWLEQTNTKRKRKRERGGEKRKEQRGGERRGTCSCTTTMTITTTTTCIYYKPLHFRSWVSVKA